MTAIVASDHNVMYLVIKFRIDFTVIVSCAAFFMQCTALFVLCTVFLVLSTRF